MVNAVLLVKRRNWFGADQFATRGMHGFVSEGMIDVAENGLDQVAAVIDLSHDAIGLVGFVSIDNAPRRLVRREPSAQIVQHVVVWRPFFAGERNAFGDRKSTRLNSSHLGISYA